MEDGKYIIPLMVGYIIPAQPRPCPDGWLPLDGSVYARSKYPELAEVLERLGFISVPPVSAERFRLPSMPGYWIKAKP